MQLQQKSALKSISFLQKSLKTQFKVINPTAENQQSKGASAVPTRKVFDLSKQYYNEQDEILNDDKPRKDYSNFIVENNSSSHSIFGDSILKQSSGIAPAIKGAVGQSRPILKEEIKTYQIIVRNNKFIPDNLKIEKGSIVEWKIQEDLSEDSELSLYSSSTRSHVIAFNDLPTESSILRLNDTFRVKFHECGHFTYKCQIYTRMKGSIKVFESYQALTQYERELQTFQRYQAAAPFDIRTLKQEESKIKMQKSQDELSQRLIEVLEEENKIETKEETPVINKKFFQEVFDKYNHHLQCEAELTSDDNFQPSEDQEDQEKEEKTFLEEQRNSSKGSKGSSIKQSSIPSHKESSESDHAQSIDNDAKNSISKDIKQELIIDQEQDQKLTPFSLLFHSQNGDVLEQEFLQNQQNQPIIALPSNENIKPQLEILEINISSSILQVEEIPIVVEQEITCAPKKAMFTVRTLEPDRKGGKQISKEYLIQSNNLIQDDPTLAKAADDQLREIEKKQRFKLKRKQYLLKRKEKESNQRKPNAFDMNAAQLIKDKQQKDLIGNKVLKEINCDMTRLQKAMALIQLQYDKSVKTAVYL
ncbi:UNKNOWN [Stylonychia lemnae]|uniref:Uncharacterized protein n=1 Tax=Stylonychia lemnae TaxID=5949 RepID=A0A078B1E3_STYLE|nr:UNKNOWN [Stylonychia lemnae]|eukprot:CDW87023.1 UNKNOWN [Stylonychia lemnae]